MSRDTRILEAQLTWTGRSFEPGIQLELRPDGRFGRIGRDLGGDVERLAGRAVLPGFVNAHSHAFQRGLRGRGQRFPAGAGSFWSWREAMYELVESLDEEAVFRWSRQAFAEMRACGITTVGEFHYLHHTGEGEDYRLDEPVIEAAQAAGVRLVLLYTYYRTGGVPRDGEAPALAGGQRRFHIPSTEAYWQRMRVLAGRLDPARERLAAAVHSVRAAPAAELDAVHREARRRGLAFHIHLEEQRREIEECRTAYGQGPLQLLLDLGAANGTSAVHLTHSSGEELTRFAQAGGGAVLCAITEADLGDGTPDAPAMTTAGLPLALGSDSNVRISMLEEMRWLEYGQRLVREERGVLRHHDAVAARLLQVATRGGARAIGAPAGALEPGRWADLVAVDLEHPSLAGWTAATLAESLVFGAADGAIAGTCVAGTWDETTA
ncbi:MAG: formimidoylglutamate deiminase [Thermoanaerobaculia bacterium]